MTRPSFTLRAALPADSADINRLVHALAAFERLSDEAVATEADFRAHLFGDAPSAQAELAEIGGRIVGMAIWFFNFNTFTCRRGLYLEDLFVEPEFRALGIGRAFFVRLAQRAVQAGCSRMEWSVLDWNENAIRFYRSMGAIGMDEWTVQRLNAEKIALLAGEGVSYGGPGV
jgi:GNAT superfamily N-acetyltransferase